MTGYIKNEIKSKFLFKIFLKKKLNFNFLPLFSFINHKYYDLNFYFFMKILKKKVKNIKKHCVILFRKKNVFLIMHVYINNRLMFVTNYEKKMKTMSSNFYTKIICKQAVKAIFKNIHLDKLCVIIQMKQNRFKYNKKLTKKKSKKSGKIRFKKTRTFMFKQIFKFVFILFYFMLKKTKIKLSVKYLFNTPHAHVNEKLKKKRRK